MYGIYANIWGIWMVNITIYIYISYMDPMGTILTILITHYQPASWGYPHDLGNPLSPIFKHH